MKKLTTIIALFFSITTYGQRSNDGGTTNALPAPSDTITLISKTQIEFVRQSLLKRLEPMEGTLIAAKYNGLAEGINAVIEELINLWQQEYLKRKIPVR